MLEELRALNMSYYHHEFVSEYYRSLLNETLSITLRETNDRRAEIFRQRRCGEFESDGRIRTDAIRLRVGVGLTNAQTFNAYRNA